MKIQITFDLDKRDRLAIANHHGNTTLPDYADCKIELTSMVYGIFEDYHSDLQNTEERKKNIPCPACGKPTNKVFSDDYDWCMWKDCAKHRETPYH